MNNKQIVVAALFVFAFLWIGLMGLVGLATGKTGVIGAGPYTDDGSIVARITHLDKTGFPKVVMTLKVTDKDGKIIPGLAATEIETAENGQTVKYQNFAGAGHAPVRICLCIDYSKSMAGKKIEGAKSAALALLGSLRDGTDHLALYFFSGNRSGDEKLAMGVLDPARRKLAEDVIRNTPLAGGTPMLANMELALSKLRDVSGKRVLVVMTDGNDTTPGAQQKIKPKVIAAAQELKVTLHMIALDTGKGGGKGNNEYGMKELSEPTGGKFYFAPKPEDLEGIYQSIGQALKDEYVVEYDSPNPAVDGQTRRVAVIVRKGNIGTKADTSYDLAGVAATGTVARAAPASIGTAEQAGVPFASVLIPLGVLLSGLFAGPYFWWLKPKGEAAG